MVNGPKRGHGEEVNLNTKTRYELERRGNEVDSWRYKQKIKTFPADSHQHVASLSSFSHYPHIISYFYLLEKGANTFFAVE